MGLATPATAPMATKATLTLSMDAPVGTTGNGFVFSQKYSQSYKFILFYLACMNYGSWKFAKVQNAIALEWRDYNLYEL
jgi:hypothetical protein